MVNGGVGFVSKGLDFGNSSLPSRLPWCWAALVDVPSEDNFPATCMKGPTSRVGIALKRLVFENSLKHL